MGEQVRPGILVVVANEEHIVALKCLRMASSSEDVVGLTVLGCLFITIVTCLGGVKFEEVGVSLLVFIG